MPYQFTNNATSILRQDTPAASTTITLPSGEGARFPQPTGAYNFMVTLEDRRTGQIEICKCTARTADVLTVTRAQEGTTAQLFVAGATVSNRVTAQQLVDLQAASLGVPEAPVNANQYARQNAAWTIVNWANLAGKPTTFTPIAHTHPISEVTGLQAALDAESSARASADTTLTNNLAAETTSRTNNDTTLTNNLNSEITNRTNADTTLTTNLNSEISNRTNADAALQTDINTRATTTALNTEITNRVADVDAEEAARTAADNLRVLKAGDTMTGALVLPGDPTAALQAATKQYVDNPPTAFAHRSGSGTVTITPAAAWQKLNLGTISSGINVGGWTISGGNLIVPKTGVYMLGVSAGIQAVAATATAMLVGVGINSVAVPAFQQRIQNPAATGTWVMNAQRPVSLTAGDALSLLVFNSVGTTNTVTDSNDSTFLWATFLTA